MLLLVSMAALLAFQGFTHFGERSRVTRQETLSAVVMPAPLQILIYAGDRFLAANVEAIRAVMSGGIRLDAEADFRLRAHREVSRLNPCHEDNYWIGNAELTWGGSHDAGYDLLRNAIECRTWDEWPAFFYGFNQYFFNRNVTEAQRALELAARRAQDERNAAAFKTLAVMVVARTLTDVRLAIDLVERERDQAKDARLRDRLDSRAKRLRGLLVLRDAQAAYEAGTGKPLSDPELLISQGYLAAVPNDPLGLGYVFANGEFQLQERRNESLERLRQAP
jgi:hypothetical protein